MGAGEIATASDSPAIVVGSGSAPVAGTSTQNHVLQPFPAIRALAISAASAVTQTLLADCARLQLSITGNSAVTLTIGTASPAAPVLGQDFTVEFVAAGTGGVTLNGVSIGSQPGSATLRSAYQFRFDGTVWQPVSLTNSAQYGVPTGVSVIDGYSAGNISLPTSSAAFIVGGIQNRINLLGAVGNAVVRGFTNTVNRSGSILFGSSNNAYGQNAVALGTNNTVNGDGGFAASAAFSGSGGASVNGQSGIAIGNLSQANGANSCALNGGLTGNAVYDAVSASSAFTMSNIAPTMTVTLTTVASAGNYAVNDYVTLQVSGSTNYISGLVTTAGNATTGVIGIKANASAAGSITIAANQITGVLNTSIGSGSVSLGSGVAAITAVLQPLAFQFSEVAFGGTGFNGWPFASGTNISGQGSLFCLGGQIPSGTAAGVAVSNTSITTATAAECTLNTFAYNGGKLPGSSNRIVFPADGLSLVCEILVNVKQETTANASRCRICFQAVRNGGTITVDAVTIDVAPVNMGTGIALSTTTPVAVQINTTNTGLPALVFTPQLTAAAPGNVDVNMVCRASWLMAA